jgi:outer membrane immunogenic protein
MKKFIVATFVFSLLMVAPAFAADMPAKARYGALEAPLTWRGFYIGANGGYAFDGDNKNPVETAGGGVSLPAVDINGGFGGGQIGYNWQDGNWVWSVETDIQGGKINGQRNYSVAPASPVQSNVDVDYFGTIRARLGVAYDRALLYATGGFAYGNVNYKIRDAGGASLFRRDDVQTGYVLGGGLEYKMAHDWSWKVEYQYIDLGNFTVARDPSGAIIAGITVNNATANFQTIRVGLNWTGNWWNPAR